MNDFIYLDHNATTQPAGEVIEEMTESLRIVWANPSSTHVPGQAARRALADARTRVATFLGCQGAELVFTSGATEANHMAILGALALGKANGRQRLVMSAVEHPGMLALADKLRSEGITVDLIPVNARGELDLNAAAALIGHDVALVSVMGANNETGVLMPTAELAALAHAAGTWLHVDATQLVGKTTARFSTSGADLWSVSAHKVHGPKGVGALIIRKGLSRPPGRPKDDAPPGGRSAEGGSGGPVVWPALFSGRQERNRRGGTENLPGIVGFAAAAERAGLTLANDVLHMQALQTRLEAGLRSALPAIHLYGDGATRLPNTSCLRFATLDAEQVLGKLERAGVMASSGAACTASGTQPSHVLLAMGEPALHAKASVRLSIGRDTTADDIDKAIEAAVRVIGPLLTEMPTEALAA